jgi:Mor family transcriptional regulator
MKYADFKPVKAQELNASDLHAVQDAMDPSAPEVWVELAEILYVPLRASPALESVPDEGLAVGVAQAIYQMATELGGTPVYIPKGIKPITDQKRRAIAAQFKGHNHAELALAHGVTQTRVRQILAEQAAAAKGKTK